MPKKTKKEKLLALYHKKIRLLENNQVGVSANSTVVKISTPLSVTPVDKEVPRLKPVEITHKYFFSDLRKSLILITLIIGLEVSLYFAGLVK